MLTRTALFSKILTHKFILKHALGTVTSLVHKPYANAIEIDYIIESFK